MDSSREQIRAKLIERFTEKLDKTLISPTVTMTDIENVVGKLQQNLGQEIAEGLLALKKTVKKD
jgi:hypothetical protein